MGEALQGHGDAQARIRHLETELAQAKAGLQRYQDLVEGVVDWFWEVDAQGRYTYVSPSVLPLLGYTPAEVLGRTPMDLMPPEEAARVGGLFADLVSRQQPLMALENVNLHKDGRQIVLETSGVPIRDPEGRFCGYRGCDRDITDRKRVMTELDEQLQLFNTLLVHLPLGVFLIRAGDGAPLLANAHAVELLGQGIMPGAKQDNLAVVYRAFRAGTNLHYPTEEMPLSLGLRGIPHRVDDMEVELPDGSRRLLEIHGCPVKDSKGRVWASLVCFADITSRRQAESDRLALEQKIQQTQKLESLGVLAGGIAHDFNNILMAILGHAELGLERLSPVSPGRDHFHQIERASRRAAELCRQMLAYAGKSSFSRHSLFLGDLVDEMAHLLKTSISKKAILNVHCERGLPPILADPSQIRQIILNLIINASDAIGERSGVINISVGASRCDGDYLARTELAESLKPGFYLHIEVSDTGSGMTPEVRARIFEPFFTTKFTGRGLGLAAVLGIIKAHHGAIKVYSEPGKGTTFKLLFPVQEGVAVPGPAESSSTRNWQGRGTVLLADDEESLRALGAEMLECLGFEVVTAEDGRAAVEQYRQRTQDIRLAILDLTMPHLDGIETFAALRRIDPGLPVILASGYSHEDVAARFAGKGLTGVLQKPYTIAKLTELLSKVQPGP